MKRITCILIGLLLLLTACGSPETATKPNETNNESAVTETQPVSIMDELGTQDFEGRTFTILDSNENTNFHVNIPGDTLNGETVNDALINRDSYIEEKYNVTVDYVQKTSFDNTLKNSVLAGDDIYNMTITRMLSNQLVTLATEGILANLRDMEDLSLDQLWWSPLMYDSMGLGGKMYFTTGDIAPSVYQTPCCMFLNLRLVDDYNIETDIYQQVLDGQWTLEAVETIVKDMDRDVDNDGLINTVNDFYGIVMQSTTETSDALITGAGLQACQITSDGMGLEITDFSGDTTTVIDNIMKFTKTIKYSDINDLINITFKEGRALLLQHKLESAAVHLRDMNDDYLILPMPKRDENQASYISCVSGYVNCFVGIPVTTDYDFTGFMAEALARYSYENIRPLAYNMIYTEKLVRDPRSADVLEILFNTLYVDYNVAYNFGGLGDVFKDVIFNAKPLLSTAEKVATRAETQIAKFIENWNQE
jgi:hypothetical protein